MYPTIPRNIENKYNIFLIKNKNLSIAYIL